MLALTEAAFRRERLQALVRDEVAAVLRLDPAAIDPDTPLGSFGIDSFTAIELRSRLERGFRLKLSATLAWNYPTIAAMAEYLAARIDLPLPSARAAAGAEHSADAEISTLLAEIEGMSEDELARVLGDVSAGDQMRRPQ